jgi:PIN domain nuclease of toxin-antitoxin system
VRLLLDTHIALWAIADSPRLSRRARELIDNAANDIVVSAASIWEIAIKHALGRGMPNDMPVSGQEALGYFRDAGFELLDVSPLHAAGIEALPPLHGDPFDRILVAQALAIPLRLLTHDPIVAAYSDLVIEV